jgi:hypothetical protein
MVVVVVVFAVLGITWKHSVLVGLVKLSVSYEDG